MTPENRASLPQAAVFPYYRGPGENEVSIPGATAPLVIRSISRAQVDDPSRYRPHPDLAAAVNTALLLGMPLLVTGEPGCGKTVLGEAVAHALGFRWERFETKSTSFARDLFYEFDVVGRFQTKEIDGAADPSRFIEYRALGKAILLAYPKDQVVQLLPADRKDFHPGPATRRVVIIDEIDKAPRDFPNDILNEIDRMYFRVPELGPQGMRGTPGSSDPPIPIPDELRPIVIFTSNSEKKLPDAFLRRCVFFNIPPPDTLQLQAIVRARLGEMLGLPSDLDLGRVAVSEALSFFLFVRERGQTLGKPPGVAELLNWLQAIAGHGINLDQPLNADDAAFRSTMIALFKTSEDASRAMSLISSWRGRSPNASKSPQHT